LFDERAQKIHFTAAFDGNSKRKSSEELKLPTWFEQVTLGWLLDCNPTLYH